MSKQKTFIIEEVATYYVRAANSRQAEQKFLAAITVPASAGILCEVNERDISVDPEDRLNTTQEG